MANRIEYTEHNPLRGFTVLTSRYANNQIIYYGDLKRMTYTTYKREEIPTSDQDKYTVVPAGMEYRPDLMSQRVYGLPDMWWRILEANGLKDVWDFKTGLNIRLPSSVL